jgi:hypothetical protein
VRFAGRGDRILLCLLGLLMWSWLAYFNTSNALASGQTLIDSLTSLSAISPVALVPLTLIQIWKYLSAERKENIVNPHFVWIARQSLAARVIATAMCLAFVAIGLLQLVGSSASGWAGSSTISMLFIAVGCYGGFYSLFSPRIRIGLSPQGFEYSLMRPSQISWHDVVDVRLRTLFTSSWIEVVLKDTTEFRSAALFARWRRVSKLSLMPAVFGVDPDTLKKAIDIRRNVFTF